MKCQQVQRDDLQIVGIQVRTNNADEMDPATGKIGPLAARYFTENLGAQIPARKQPGR